MNKNKKGKLHNKIEDKKILFEKIRENFEQKRSMIVLNCDAFGCAC